MAVGLTCLLGFDLVLATDTKYLTPASAQTLILLENDFFLPAVLGFALFGVIGGLAVVAGRILPAWMGWVLFAVGHRGAGSADLLVRDAGDGAVGAGRRDLDGGAGAADGRAGRACRRRGACPGLSEKMARVTELVGREPQYEAPADNYRKHAADGLWNAHVDRPACLELLGDVSGKHVLDAACGPGFYAAELISRGARVTGFDNSPRMVGFSRQQAPGGEFRVHDLNDPIDWLPDASVDLVLCALAYEYADNRAGALREFRRVLKPGGALVLSRLHPSGDWLRHGGSYFDTEIVEEWWGANLDMRVRFWKEPLEAICAAIADAGFLIERLVEARPAPEAAALNPEKHERLSTGPYGFIAFRLRPAG